jgi:hypothetical protein
MATSTNYKFTTDFHIAVTKQTVIDGANPNKILNYNKERMK